MPLALLGSVFGAIGSDKSYTIHETVAEKSYFNHGVNNLTQMVSKQKYINKLNEIKGGFYGKATYRYYIYHFFSDALVCIQVAATKVMIE